MTHLIEEAGAGAFLGSVLLLMVFVLVAVFGLPWVPGSAEAARQAPLATDVPVEF